MQKETTGQLGSRDPGPHGKTVEMNRLDLLTAIRKPQDRPARDRDRSLRAKARIRARRLARRTFTI